MDGRMGPCPGDDQAEIARDGGEGGELNDARGKTEHKGGGSKVCACVGMALKHGKRQDKECGAFTRQISRAELVEGFKPFWQ